jgi:hypothetical protein
LRRQQQEYDGAIALIDRLKGFHVQGVLATSFDETVDPDYNILSMG